MAESVTVDPGAERERYRAREYATFQPQDPSHAVSTLKLWRELARVYDLLADALPLALQQIGEEHVALQHAFWSDFQELDEFLRTPEAWDTLGNCVSLEEGEEAVQNFLVERAELFRGLIDEFSCPRP